MQPFQVKAAGIVSLCLLAAGGVVSAAPPIGWQSFNPGGGGAIQGLSCHPGVPGRMYECSDMEGAYRSSDFGQSWQWIGRNLPTGFCLTITGEPKNANRLYAGTLRGLSVSDDAGQTWRTAGSPLPKVEAFACITVDPKNVQTVYAAPGWFSRDDFAKAISVPLDGARQVYISHNRGATWAASTFNPQPGRRQVYTLSVTSQGVYLGADGGAYVSGNAGKTWKRLPDPAGTDGRCLGMSVSPDERRLLAAWEIAPGNTHLYAARTGQSPVVWSDVSGGLPTPHEFWMPRIDPASRAGRLRAAVCSQDLKFDTRLYQADFDVSGETPTGKFTDVFANPYNDKRYSHDMGWNYLSAGVQHFAYTPADWGASAGRVLLGSLQSVYTGSPTDFTSYAPVSTHFVAASPGADGKPVRFYRGTGIASTYDFDFSGDGQYLVQGQADNCLVESFDGGKSWAQSAYFGAQKAGAPAVMRQNGDALAVIPLSSPVAVVGTSNGYGGGDIGGGQLYAKSLVGVTAKSSWTVAGGGEAKQGGLPNARIWSISEAPQRPSRVYCGTQTGIYASDNFGAFLATAGAQAQFFDIGAGALYGIPVDRVYADPNDAATVYVHATNGLWKGTKQSSGAYAWTRLDASVAPGSGDSSLTVWDNGGQTCVAFAKGQGVVLSVSGGPFQPVFSVPAATALHQEPGWYTPDVKLGFGGLVGTGNKLFCGLGSDTSDRQHGYGFFCGTLRPDGAVRWADWSGDKVGAGYLPFANCRHGRIVTVAGKTYVGEATIGAGLWMRPLSEAP